MNGNGHPKAAIETPAKVSVERIPPTADTGEQLKLLGLADVNAGVDDWWRDCVDRGIEELALLGHDFQAADLLELGVPEPDHPNRWGGRLHAAAMAGVIECVGFAPSKRATTRASIVRVWRGTAVAR